MIRAIILSISLLLLSGCSFKSPPNQWQHKSIAAFDSYTKNFLSSNDALAKNDLNRAIKHAKKSADLTMLSRIYLGKCALNISVGIKDSCEEYKNIADLIEDNSLDAYYYLITKNIDELIVKNLDDRYKDFTILLQERKFSQANGEVLNISNTTSKLLCASLISKEITNETRQKLISISSFNGYKKSVLFWLNEAKDNSIDENEKRLISKKISVLESSK